MENSLELIELFIDINKVSLVQIDCVAMIVYSVQTRLVYVVQLLT